MKRLIFAIVWIFAIASVEAVEPIGKILEATGVTGGLVVHVGCGENPALTLALRANDSFVVQGLESDPEKVSKVRKVVQEAGAYGPVSVISWSGGALPYVDNLVRLLVIEDGTNLSRAEIERVLSPGGWAYSLQPSSLIPQSFQKPWPDRFDEWSHYLRDATGNLVGTDDGYGLPRSFQWVDGPLYGRHHEKLSSTSAMITAGGRLFYIQDEGSLAWKMFPAQWRLICRDAFSGVRIWSVDLPHWWSHFHPLKWTPSTLARRLVANERGDRLYVAMEIGGPVSVLDAATGQTLATLPDTEGAEEIIVRDGVVICSGRTGDPLRGDENGGDRGVASFLKKENLPAIWGIGKRWIQAYDATSQKELWRTTAMLYAMSIAADSERVYFYDDQALRAVALGTGEPVWQSAPLPACPNNFAFFGPSLVVYKDVVLFSGGEDKQQKTWRLWPHSTASRLFGLDAATGRTLWENEHPRSGHGSPRELLAIGDYVYVPKTGWSEGPVFAYHYRTGEALPPIPKTTPYRIWVHQRCHLQRAVGETLLLSLQGIELVDVTRPDAEWSVNTWTRGACGFGFIPSYGMYYMPPHPCACTLDSKLAGLYALAPPRKNTPDWSLPGTDVDRRLWRGPAYETFQTTTAGPPSHGDWPTYRGDNARSGRSETVSAAPLTSAWETKLGGKITPPVCADGRVFVAAPERHEVIALDAATGRELWRFTAGGRVDSPPTIYCDGVYFGCRDGLVYALRAKDGERVWSFRAAPAARRLIAFGQPESVWPVHGSVIIEQGRLYTVAGRSMYVDGGLRMLVLDPRSGKLLDEVAYDDKDPDTGKNLQLLGGKHTIQPVGLPDILSSDGKLLYMRTQAIDLDGRRVNVEPPISSKQAGEGNKMHDLMAQVVTQSGHKHLFSPTGFLDDTWWHRTYWLYGNMWSSGSTAWMRQSGFVPAGRILCLDFRSEKVYGYGRTQESYGWYEPVRYHLFRSAMEPPFVETPKRAFASQTRIEFDWEAEVPIHVRAMTLTSNLIFAAGSPAWKEERPIGGSDNLDWRLPDTETREAEAAWHGEQGGQLMAFSTEDRSAVWTVGLNVLPVFDGLAAANGCLYLSMADGTVCCFGRYTGKNKE